MSGSPGWNQYYDLFIMNFRLKYFVVTQIVLLSACGVAEISQESQGQLQRRCDRVFALIFEFTKLLKTGDKRATSLGPMLLIMSKTLVSENSAKLLSDQKRHAKIAHGFASNSRSRHRIFPGIPRITNRLASLTS